MNSVCLIPIKNLPLIVPGDDVASLIYQACAKDEVVIKDGDIVVVAQKIISKAENAVIDLKTIVPGKEAIAIAEKTGRDARLVQVYINEAAEIINLKGRMVITRHKLGFKMSSSGVDRSNVASHDKDLVVLLPRDPDGSAKKIRCSIQRSLKKKVAVIVNDSCGRDERDGSVGMAIGIAGISHLEIRKQKDLFGNDSNSRIALIDEVAAAASMLMGQADEGIPVVIVRGVPYTVDEEADIKKIISNGGKL